VWFPPTFEVRLKPQFFGLEERILGTVWKPRGPLRCGEVRIGEAPQK
jgi:hypothetical protein